MKFIVKRKYILSIIFGFGLILSNAVYGQSEIKIISKSSSQVILNLQQSVIQDKNRIAKALNSFNTVDGIQKVELINNNNIRITYTPEKLNGPSIFIGLAKEFDFNEAKFIENK